VCLSNRDRERSWGGRGAEGGRRWDRIRSRMEGGRGGGILPLGMEWIFETDESVTVLTVIEGLEVDDGGGGCPAWRFYMEHAPLSSYTRFVSHLLPLNYKTAPRDPTSLPR